MTHRQTQAMAEGWEIEGPSIAIECRQMRDESGKSLGLLLTPGIRCSRFIWSAVFAALLRALVRAESLRGARLAFRFCALRARFFLRFSWVLPFKMKMKKPDRSPAFDWGGGWENK